MEGTGGAGDASPPTTVEEVGHSEEIVPSLTHEPASKAVEAWLEATSTVIIALGKASLVYSLMAAEAAFRHLSHATAFAMQRIEEQLQQQQYTTRSSGVSSPRSPSPRSPRPLVDAASYHRGTRSTASGPLRGRTGLFLAMLLCAILSFSLGMSTGSAAAAGSSTKLVRRGYADQSVLLRQRDLAARSAKFSSSGNSNSRQHSSSGDLAISSDSAPPFFHIPIDERVPCIAMRQMRDQLIEHLYQRKQYLRLGQLDAETLLPLAGGFDQGPDVLYIDVGANVGQTSTAIMHALCDDVRCSEKSPCARGRRRTTVIAFEPQSEPFVNISRKAEAHSWGLCGWSVRKQAVAHEPGRLRLFGRNTQASLAVRGTRGTVDVDEQSGQAKGEEVEVTTLDAVLAETGWAGAAPGSLFLLKIDAEGFDPFVLQGAHQTLLSRLPRLIIFEYNSKWTWVSNDTDAAEKLSAPAGGAPIPGSNSNINGNAPPSTTPSPQPTFVPGPAGFTAGGQLSLRSVTRVLFETYGYACYLYGHYTFIPLSGAWWSQPLEFRRWSNVVCAREDDVILIDALLGRHSNIEGLRLPPYSRCFINMTALQRAQLHQQQQQQRMLPDDPSSSSSLRRDASTARVAGAAAASSSSAVMSSGDLGGDGAATRYRPDDSEAEQRE